MSSADDQRLALFGGTPIRPDGPIERTINRPEIEEALQCAYRNGDWHRYHGSQTDRFRDAFSGYLGISHIELCSSGTVGLELALKGVNVQRDDEVVVAGYDFKGIVSNVLAIGAVPIVVDVDPRLLSPTAEAIEAAIGVRTKAAVVSHLHGCSPPMRALTESLKSRGIPLIEDACQSPGAFVDGRAAGCWGDVGVFSFGGSKLLTAGRGGAVVTSDSRIAQRMRLHCERGNHAFPLSELQAAVLQPQLAALDAENQRRLIAVEWISSRIDPGWGFQATSGGNSAAYYKMGLLISDSPWNGISRNAIAASFRAEGIAIDEGFTAVPDLFARSRFRAVGDLKAAGLLGDRMLVLHHPVLLADESEWNLVLQAMEKVAKAAIAGAFADAASS